MRLQGKCGFFGLRLIFWNIFITFAYTKEILLFHHRQRMNLMSRSPLSYFEERKQ